MPTDNARLLHKLPEAPVGKLGVCLGVRGELEHVMEPVEPIRLFADGRTVVLHEEVELGAVANLLT